MHLLKLDTKEVTGDVVPCLERLFRTRKLKLLVNKPGCSVSLKLVISATYLQAHMSGFISFGKDSKLDPQVYWSATKDRLMKRRNNCITANRKN